LSDTGKVCDGIYSFKGIGRTGKIASTEKPTVAPMNAGEQAIEPPRRIHDPEKLRWLIFNIDELSYFADNANKVQVFKIQEFINDEQ